MISLTSSEKKTIIFTAAIIVISGIFQWIQPNKIKQPSYDYSESDSVFMRLSRAVTISLNQETDKIDSSEFLKNKNLNAIKTSRNPSKKMSKNELLPNSININTASEIDFQKLPRIGPKIAKRIIDYRKKLGLFKSTDDLLKVKGIGKKTLEKLIPFICVK